MSNEQFYSLSPEKLLALTAYGEAASEGVEGMMAVINVIINRAKYPKTEANWFDDAIYASTNSVWHAVILSPKQFSAFNSTDPVRNTLINLMQNFDYNLQYNTILNQAYQLGQLAVSGLLEDNTYGATHYYNPTKAAPTWALKIPVIGVIGNHVFHSVYSASQRIREIYTAGTEYVKQKTGINATYVLAILMAAFGGLLIIRKRRS